MKQSSGFVLLLLSCVALCDAVASSPSNNLPPWLGRRYEPTEDEWSHNNDDDTRHQQQHHAKDTKHPLRIVGGRDFDLFDSRQKSHLPHREVVSQTKRDLSDVKDTVYKSTEHPDDTQEENNWPKQRSVRNVSTNNSNSNKEGIFHYYNRNTDANSRARKFSEYGRSSKSSSGFFLIPPPVAEWWTDYVTPNIKNWPKLQCRVEPTTTLKIRKTFRPLKTIIQLGADFNTQLGVWQFKSSWEDAIIGGKLTLAGRELQLTKSWQLSVGAVEDLVTRLRLRAAVDLQTWKAYARVGFRTERLAPINMMEGFTLMKQVPLDGSAGHIKLEVKANFALPEPEIEYSTESNRSIVGMGNIEVSIEELNLVLDY